MVKIKIIILLLLFAYNLGFSQSISPAITFTENPLTHNVHICSDGKYYYTVNGGKDTKGTINKYDLQGNLIDSYKILLDMRSVMYNNRDKKLYVCTFDKMICKVTDLECGNYEIIVQNIYENAQSVPALSADGKLLYVLNKNTVNIYKFPSGKLYKTLNGIDAGKDAANGSTAIAVGTKYFYTWNTGFKKLFVYDFKGKKIKSLDIKNGTYGYSLSYANGMIFVAKDGNYNTGVWYGYIVNK